MKQHSFMAETVNVTNTAPAMLERLLVLGYLAGRPNNSSQGARLWLAQLVE